MDHGTLSQLTDDATVLLVDQDDLAIVAAAYVTLAWSVVLGVVCLDVTLALLVLGSLRTLEEGCALRQDSLEGVDVLLRDRSRALANWRELNACEGAALWAQVPSRYQVAARRLVVDLRRRGEWEVELRRQVQVEVEVFFGRFVLAARVAEICKGRVGRDH